MNFLSLFKRNLIYKFKKKISIDKDSFSKKDLDQLFFYYGSDKANFFQNKNKRGHGFSKFYEKQLSILKDKPVNILEIGSYAGASAAAFSKYFYNSKIFCFDIKNCAIISLSKEWSFAFKLKGIFLSAFTL